MTAAYQVARAGIRVEEGLATAGDVIRKEGQDAAFATRVRDAAREAFITGGKIPFVATFVDGKEVPPGAWLSSKVFRLKKGAYNPAGPKISKGPTVDDIPAASRNRRRIAKCMAALNYEEHLPVYEDGSKPPSHKDRVIKYPTETVQDVDEHGTPLFDADGNPVMVTQALVDFNPLFEAPTGEAICSLVQTKAIIGVTNGGASGKYGVTLTLAGPITIVAQAEVRHGTMYQYDDTVATGLFRKDVEEEAEPDEETGGVEVSTADALPPVVTSGLIGAPPEEPAAAATNGKRKATDPAGPPAKRAAK